MKIQEIHMPKYSMPPALKESGLSELNLREMKIVADAIDDVWKKNENDLNIYIICEMAKKYLDLIAKDKKCCGPYAESAEFEGVCCNGLAESRGGFHDADYVCNCWEEKLDDKQRH